MASIKASQNARCQTQRLMSTWGSSTSCQSKRANCGNSALKLHSFGELNPAWPYFSDLFLHRKLLLPVMFFTPFRVWLLCLKISAASEHVWHQLSCILSSQNPSAAVVENHNAALWAPWSTVVQTKLLVARLIIDDCKYEKKNFAFFWKTKMFLFFWFLNFKDFYCRHWFVVSH